MSSQEKHNSGKLIILAGPSGSGKSTFARQLENDQVTDSGMNAMLPESGRIKLIKPRDLTLFSSGEQVLDRENTYLLHIAINNSKDYVMTKKNLIQFFLDQLNPQELVIVTFVPDKYTLVRMYYKRMIETCDRNENVLLRKVCAFSKHIDLPKVLQIFRYLFTDALPAIYAKWELYLATLRDEYAARISIDAVYVRPEYIKGAKPEWVTHVYRKGRIDNGENKPDVPVSR